MGRLLIPLVVIAAMGLAGCAEPHTSILHPGTMQAQQAQAQRFDPYPDPTIGPPVAGGRPREYEVPMAESTRLSNSPWNPANTARAPGAYPPTVAYPLIASPPPIQPMPGQYQQMPGQ